MAFRDDVASGDRETALEAIRDRLAVEVVQADTKDVAALVRQLRGVLDDLAVGGSDVEVGDIVDDLAARRVARGAGTEAV